jgi:hypothetical protein
MSASCKCCNVSLFVLGMTHLGTLVRGDSIFHRKHQSINWELRLKVSWCGKPLSWATLKAIVPNKGCLKSSTFNGERLMLRRPVEAAPKKAAKSTQKLVSNTIRLPWQRLFVLFLSYKASARALLKRSTAHLSQSWKPSIKLTPPPQVAEAFNQSKLNPSGLNSHTSIQPNLFSKRTNCLILPPEQQALVWTCQGLQPRQESR